ncbi:hypothetical protein AB4238_21685 [Shewanella sp. 10N.286.45.A1]|uniref:hypothetical protein n=1 Tax=Shewanella sp. 10N.286.45.A1 TaxID=3229694 RepID=UPI0035544680
MISKIKCLVSISLTFIVSAQAADNEGAPIVDYKPNCITKTFAPHYLNVEVLDYSDLGAIEDSPAFVLALQQLRQDATALGAEVMLLTNVENIKITKEKNRTGRRAGPKVVRTTDLKIHIAAQAYKLCNGDKSYSNDRASYTTKGFALQSTQYSYTVSHSSIITAKEPAMLAQETTLPPANVSFSTGVYGINLGVSTTQTAQKLGPPSIILTLDNNDKVWGYGRNLWFTYSADKLKSVSSTFSILNGAGKNNIGFRDGFDDKRWRIEDKIAQKNSIEQVRNSLSKHDITELPEQIIITQKQQRIILQFDKFHPTTKDDPVTLLTNFTYTSKIDESARPSLPQLTSIQEHWLYKHLQPNNVKSLTLLNLMKQIPQANKINIANDHKQWWLVGNNVLLQFHGTALGQAHVSEPFFTGYNNDAFFQSVKLLKLPLNKKGMLEHYTDANDNYDEIDVSREDFNLIAKFESEENDAAVYDLVFTYY